MMKAKDIIKTINKAITQNNYRLLEIADTEEEQRFLAKEGKKLEQIRDRFAAKYGHTSKQKKQKQIPKILKEEYGDTIEHMSLEKLDFFIKLEERNLKQLEINAQRTQEACDIKSAEIRTLKAIQNKKRLLD